MSNILKHNIIIDKSYQEFGDINCIGWKNQAAAIFILIIDKSYNLMLIKQNDEYSLAFTYLNYDELLRGAAIDGVFEQTGLTVDTDEFILFDIIDDLKYDNQRKLTYVYLYFYPEDIDKRYLYFNDNLKMFNVWLDSLDNLKIRDNDKEVIANFKNKIVEQNIIL